MTFKHVKFEDSPTMRALEKVAKDKGLVKAEPLKKTASVPKRPDYTPSSNLMENVLKLCAGLRNQGLVKEAAELETNFLNYKQAQHLYEAHKEKGEDLIHAAHPKGSHKLEGVEGDALVEDILEQQMKHLEVVNKKPTGKLSTAQAISEVKKVLGQIVAPKESESKLYGMLNDKLNKLLPLIGTTISILKTDGGEDYDVKSAEAARKDMQSALASRPFDRTAYRAALAGLQKLQKTSKTGNFKTSNWFGSPDADDPGVLAWNKRAGGQMGSLVNSLNSLDSILTKLENIRALKEQGNYQEPVDEEKKNAPLTIAPVTISDGPLGQVYRQIANFKAQLNTWSTYRSISSDPQAANWIKEEIESLNDIAARMDKVPDNEEAEKEALPNFQRELADEQKSIAEFKTGWVDPK